MKSKKNNTGQVQSVAFCGAGIALARLFYLRYSAAVKKLASDKTGVLEDVRLMQSELCDTTSLEREQEELEQAIARTDHEIETLIYDNARRAQDQEEYNRRFEHLRSEYDKAVADAVRVGQEIERRKKKSLELVAFARALEAEYDDRLLMALVDKVIVGEGIKVVFKNGVVG